MSRRIVLAFLLLATVVFVPREGTAQLDLNAPEHLRYAGAVRAAIAAEARPCGCPNGLWRTTIRFAIDRQGRLAEITFARRSGAETADAAALGMVQRAAPRFPKRPKTAGVEPLYFMAPIAFQDGKPVTLQAPGFRP